MKQKDEHRNRFKQFRSELADLIQRYLPDAVVIEDSFYGRNVKTLAYLSQLKGIALELIPSDIPCNLVTVKSARLKVFGFGAMEKTEVFERINRKYKLCLTFEKGNDITDSIVLGLSYGR